MMSNRNKTKTKRRHRLAGYQSINYIKTKKQKQKNRERGQESCR